MNREIYKLDNKRLALAAQMVRPGVRAADIGTDHGYLSLFLASAGKCPHVVATDINALPLERAAENIARFAHRKSDILSQISLRLCDGLSQISENECEDIIICGMGGEVIAHILSTADWVKSRGKHYILQPMSSPEELRKFLRENRFFIDRELALIDKEKTYSVISAYWTGHFEPLAEDFDFVGKLRLCADEESRHYGERAVKHIENLRKGSLARGEVDEAARYAHILALIRAKMQG